jgi:hypothetical protein
MTTNPKYPILKKNSSVDLTDKSGVIAPIK